MSTDVRGSVLGLCGPSDKGSSPEPWGLGLSRVRVPSLPCGEEAVQARHGHLLQAGHFDTRSFRFPRLVT